MFDPLSLFAIAGSIAALISGFKDARDMFSKWLRRRRESKVERKQRELDDALKDSPGIVQREYNRGRERFGSPFTRGDDIAISSMTQTLIRMNEQLISVLKAAIGAISSTHVCCERLYSAATGASDEASQTLTQLGQRLLAKAPLRQVQLFPINMSKRSVSFPYSITPDDRIPFSNYAPQPQRRASGPQVAIPSHPPPRYSVQESCIPSLGPLPISHTALELEQNLQNLSIQNSVVMTPPITNHQVTVDRLQRRLSNYPIAPDVRTSATSNSDEILAHNLSSRQSSDRTMNVSLASQTASLSSQKPARSPIWCDSEQVYTSSRDITDRTFRQSCQIHSEYSGSHINQRFQADDYMEKTIFQTSDSVAELPASGVSELDSSTLNGDGAPSRIPFRNSYPTGGSLKSLPSVRRQTTQSQNRPSSSITKPHNSLYTNARSQNRIPPSAVSTTVTSFCPVALHLQRNPAHTFRGPNFSFSAASDPLCTACNSTIPSQGFLIHLIDRDDVTGDPVSWEVSARFLAKCHKPSTATGAAALLGCVLCHNSAAASFRGRNELWGHLETHSSRDFDGDVDISPALPTADEV